MANIKSAEAQARQQEVVDIAFGAKQGVHTLTVCVEGLKVTEATEEQILETKDDRRQIKARALHIKDDQYLVFIPSPTGVSASFSIQYIEGGFKLSNVQQQAGVAI